MASAAGAGEAGTVGDSTAPEVSYVSTMPTPEPPPGNGGGDGDGESPSGRRRGRKVPRRQGLPTVISFTPDSMAVPVPPKSRLKSQLTALPRIRSLRTVAEARAEIQSIVPRRERILDGYLLLEVARAHLPTDAEHVDCSNRGLTKVTEDDIRFFTKLRFLDVSSNHELQPRDFALLPALEDLRMQCNGLYTLDPVMPQLGAGPFFECLTRLDLSYNCLDAEGVAELAALPWLEELDLTGNGIELLPPRNVMSGFSRLAKLVLERNHLEDSARLFHSVARMPALRELCLAYNFIAEVPSPALLEASGLMDDGSTASPKPEQDGGGEEDEPGAAGAAETEADAEAARAPAPQTDEEGMRWRFPQLQTLDLAFNFIEHEAYLAGICHFPRIQRVFLYGNPLLGGSGEDGKGKPLQMLLDAFKASQVGWTGGGPGLQLVTEAPRRRIADRSTQRSAYTGHEVTSVDNKPLPRAQDFLEAGNKILEDTIKRDKAVQKEIEVLKGRHSKSILAKTIMSMPQSFMASQEKADDFFVTGVDAGGFPEDQANPAGDSMEASKTSSAASMHNQATAELSTYENWINSLVQGLPSSLLKKHVNSKPKDPGKLRTAMHALRYALDHPLSSHNDDDIPDPPVIEYVDMTRPLPGYDVQEDQHVAKQGQYIIRSGLGYSKGPARATQSYYARALPRRPFVPIAEKKKNFRDIKLRGTQSKQDLADLEQVLDAMNTKLERLGTSTPSKMHRGAMLSAGGSSGLGASRGAGGQRVSMAAADEKERENRMTSLLTVMAKVIHEMEG
mmetsp:Transcript_46064/g.144146  ORF Transcript_46064/g.144146 Transcript_46064/m.144146 type:complete len:790 (-) Transcript_46064:347-2716(-)|eukprot:CAMPEP_0118872732 /NCGR_PEP_ID=MMETSP1163-20130328/14812_1 /TAXON_ID=124430 /ORGANISM="Phaeomonas parva, Strain CCMP2877" /LENGTH=789 /DNA_ID=CAMNT_0006807949 /DNA_START=22 /DNA_END=2391 /DNA_ORIENTATION=-